MAASDWEALAPWERYELRVHAVLATWNSPVLMLESSAVIHGLPIFGEPRHVHLLSADGTTRREGDVIIHGARDGRAVVDRDGVLLTTIAETAVDLARVLPPAFTLAVADAALRVLAGSSSLDLSAHGRAQANRRGVRQLDWVQERASAIAESAGESVSRAVIEWLGYEAPVPQQEFRYEGHVDRGDFYFEKRRVVGESDGYGKYHADDPVAMKEHFVREKMREDRLRRYEGGFARWDWSDAMRAIPLDRKLRAAGLRPIVSPNSGMLATLDENPRSLPHRRTQGFSSNHGAA